MSREKNQQLSQAGSFITGMPKHCSKMSFSVNGVTYTTPKVVSACNALLSADNATVQAKAEYGAAVSVRQRLRGDHHPGRRRKGPPGRATP